MKDDADKSRQALLEELQALRSRVATLDGPRSGSDETWDPYRSVVQAIVDGIWAVDTTGRSILINANMATMLGFTMPEMLGRSVADFQHSDGKADCLVMPDENSETAIQDIAFRCKDGSRLWTSVTASHLRGPGGRNIGLLYRVSDISQRKEHEVELQHEIDLFRQFGEAIEDVAWITRWPEKTVEYVSPAYEEIWGGKVSELYSNPLDWLAPIHPEDRKRVEKAFRERVLEGGYDEVFRLVRPDRTTAWVRDRGFAVRDAQGIVRRVAGIAEEITDRRRAEIFQEGQSRVLGQLATGQPLHVVLESLVRMMEEQSDEMLGSVLLYDEASGRLLHASGPSLSSEYNAAINGTKVGPNVGSCGTAVFRRERVIVEDIETDPLWTDYRELAREHGLRAGWSQPIFSAQGKVLGTFAMYYRIRRRPTEGDLALIEAGAHLAGIAIERMRTLQTIEESETRLREIIDLVPHMIFAKDMEGRFILANKAHADAYGTTVDQLVGHSHGDLHGEDREVAKMLLDDRDVIQSGRRKFIPEETFTDHKGCVRALQTTKIPFTQSISGEPAILGVAIDITERKTMERQLSDYAERMERLFLERPAGSDGFREWFASYFDNVLDFLVTARPDGTISGVNQALAETLGHQKDQLCGLHVSDLVAADSAHVIDEAAEELCAGNVVNDLPCRLLRPDGTPVEVSCSGRAQTDSTGQVEELRLIFHDIDRRESIRRRMLRTEQLVTTGRLAASVAHEVNNPLQALLMHLAVVGDALPGEFPETSSWDSIQAGVERIRQVVNDLLDLHRVGRSRREMVDVNGLVQEAMRLAKTQLRAKGVTQQARLDEGLPPVHGVSQHLYQVILNLLLNGADAVGRDGVLTIATRNSGGNVVIEVHDDGPGIPAEELPHIFTPLYTGRKSAGTGLGLFVTYNLVREHDGDIEVESRPGEGTLFRIQLPSGHPAPRQPPFQVV